MAGLKQLARRFQIKLAIEAEGLRNVVIADVKKALENASTQGVEKTSVMPFIAMLQQDQATLSMTLMRDKDEVSITNLSVSKPELAGKYGALSDQCTRYLNKNLELFPTVANGEAINYDRFTCQLTFP